MHVDSQFSVGIHTLLVIGFFDQDKITSGMVAKSIGCNPVIVRNVFAKLSKAGLLRPGKGNARTELGRSADEITLRDVFEATQDDDVDSVYNMYPENPYCPVGSEIHSMLHSRFSSALESMQADLSKTTIADLISEIPQEKKQIPEALRGFRGRFTSFRRSAAVPNSPLLLQNRCCGQAHRSQDPGLPSWTVLRRRSSNTARR